jgi:hypothetical protein
LKIKETAMSTHAAAKQKTRNDESAPAPVFELRIISNSSLSFLNGVLFRITNSVPSPVGLMTTIEGTAETSPPIPFHGYYNSGQVISFSLTHDGVLHTFFGVISPLDNAVMGGCIISGDLTQLPEGAEDEGSWSSQAPPRPEDAGRAPRKTAATKKRA